MLHAGLREKHQHELETLTLTAQPFKTLKFFVLALYGYVKQSFAYLLEKGGWLLVFSTLVISCGVLSATIEGPHEKVLHLLTSMIILDIDIIEVFLVSCLYLTGNNFELGKDVISVLWNAMNPRVHDFTAKIKIYQCLFDKFPVPGVVSI